MNKKNRILPSILSADLLNLSKEISAVMNESADMIHFDAMDNHYVPNLTFGPSLCANIRKAFPKLPIDVHLMVSPVDKLIHAFAKAGAHRISIHANATTHLDRSLKLIKEHGIDAGIAINPGEGIEHLEWVFHHISYVLVMSVNPGFGGQTFIPQTIEKIKRIHSEYPNLTICVDGGINEKNILSIKKAGASEFIVGSSLFHSLNYNKVMTQLRQLIEDA